ncbi:Hsp70 family protein [Actinoplanes awajinensis]|uniref:Hsp70 family protein n=1 Tax=Actinoplanes awajinensis TaxID=135946 RepID=UPI000B19D62A|nr:Hsp70 family protein [Actinoplanes awajinensis]
MYALGIDLGTTYTAAAVWRADHAEIASLGSRSAAIPTVVLLRADETFLTGESASRRGLSEPHRVAREFKRRLGDPTPILLGGVPHSAESLMARVLRAVVDEVSAREGSGPAAICVSHPANWGPYKTDLMQQVIRLAGIEQKVQLTTEPQAAAVFYAQQQRLEPGATVAVYDLGGGTFDAAVLRKTPDGFELIGQPEGIERLGGIDFDAAIFAHVAGALGGALDDLDEDDPAVIAAVARLREECVQAKEALSADTDATIPVLLPNLSTEVRLTRSELESMVRPVLHGSIEALRRAIRSAGTEPAELHSVLLVGGSSRIPLIAQMVGSELGRPVAVDAHPKHAVALGAAWQAGTAITKAAGASALPPAVDPWATGAAAAVGAAAGAGVPPQSVPTQSVPTQSIPQQATPPQTSPAQAGAAQSGPAQARAAQSGPAQAGSSPTAPLQTGTPQAGAPQAGPGVAGARASARVEPTVILPPTSGTATRPVSGAPAAGGPGTPRAGGSGSGSATVGAATAGAATVGAATVGAATVGAARSTGRPAGPPPKPPTAPGKNGNGGGGRKARGPILVAAAVAVVLAGVTGTAWAMGAFDSKDSPSTPAAAGLQHTQQHNSSPGTTNGTTNGAATSPATTAVPADEACTDQMKQSTRWVCLTRATIRDGKFTLWYDAEWNGVPADTEKGFHLHIYGGDGQHPDESTMGSQATAHGKYYYEDKEPSIRRVTDSDYEAVGNATKVCARIAKTGHGMVRAADGSYHTGNCIPIKRE